MAYDQLERAIIAWAQGQESVRALLAVGSRARLDHPADEWSDLDLILFTDDPAYYTTGPGWLEGSGQVWLAVSGTMGRGDPEWDVIYAGGDKVDWVIVNIPGAVEDGLAAWIAASSYSFVLERGVRILVDKIQPGRADPARVVFPITRRPNEPPTQQQFDQAVQAALLAATRAARFLRRGDLWRAYGVIACALKNHILVMLEWHAHALHGPDAGTWYDGRFMTEWADPHAVAGLPATCATYNPDSLWQALEVSLSLFRRLALETANRLEYYYPQDADDRITGLIRALAPA